MANITLTEATGFALIPEGRTTFKIMAVDDSRYEDFGRLSVKMQTSKGEIHFENFTLMRADGSWNDKALRAWSYFARTCIRDYNADSIDTQDIVGRYITATVEHVTYTRTRGEHAGEQATAVRLTDLESADGFPAQAAETPVNVPDDIEDFLSA